MPHTMWYYSSPALHSERTGNYRFRYARPNVISKASNCYRLSVGTGTCTQCGG